MKNNKKTQTLSFPSNLLTPVGKFLQDQLTRLRMRRAEIDKDDPFKNENRVAERAAIDTEAEEQFGHAMTSALKEQLDRRIIQTRKAMSRVWIGKYGICENCGNMIDTDRLVVYPEATRCIKCEKKR